MAHLNRLTPMLGVFDLRRTMAFYCDGLGFRPLRTFGSPEPVWCYLRRDGVDLMFLQRPGIPIADVRREDPNSHALYFYPDDLAGLHAQWQAKGLAVTALRVTRHAFRQFDLHDPDGHCLRFIEPTSEPLAGEQ